MTTKMSFLFEANQTLRAKITAIVKNLSIEQLHTIPKGLNNNIVWNIGHIVASQQILCYKLGNANLLVPDSFIEKYRKGTSPKNWTHFEDYNQLEEYMELTNTIKEHYQKNLFVQYTEYETSMGFKLITIEDALIYNYGHENLHYGTILNLIKLLS